LAVGCRAGAACGHFVGGAASGDAVLRVAAQVRTAMGPDEGAFRFGIGVLRPQLHAVGGAGAVGVGIGQVVIDVTEVRSAGRHLGHFGERVVRAHGDLVGVGLVVLSAEVVQ